MHLTQLLSLICTTGSFKPNVILKKSTYSKFCFIFGPIQCFFLFFLIVWLLSFRSILLFSVSISISFCFCFFTLLAGFLMHLCTVPFCCSVSLRHLHACQTLISVLSCISVVIDKVMFSCSSCPVMALDCV